MTTPAQPPAKGKGTKFPSPRSPVTWLVILGIGLAGGAYILFRRNRAATAATAATPTPDTTDLTGEVATLQAEIADLQSSFAQGETGEAAATGGTTGEPLKAPAGLSITPHKGFADFGWSTVPGAKAYELQVNGTGGKGAGISHFDHAGTGNHAENVKLANGDYHARVRAGTSLTSLTGPWSPWKDFHVGTALHGKPIFAKGPTAVGAVNGSGGESENDSGSG